MKYYFITLFLFLSFKATAQSLQVVYGVSTDGLLNEEQKNRVSQRTKESFLKYEQNFKYISYTLNVSGSESVFQMNSSMKNDGIDGLEAAKIQASLRGIYYNNLDENLSLYKTLAYGKTYIIKSNLDAIDWNLKKESKTIDGIKTYKATAVQEYETGKGKKRWNLVAWYAPEINIPFGPANYGNLPGLILELKRGKKTYTVKKIKEIKENKIHRPIDGDIISLKEFDEIGKEMTKDLGD